MGKLPNLLIAGVAHSGTTSLFTYLSSHPEICPSKVKETHYFYPIMAGEALSVEEEYEKYFCHCENEPYVMEAGPGYLYGGAELAKLIKKTLGEVKLVFIIRDPIARLYSFFKYNNKVMNIEDVSFDDFVQISVERLENKSLPHDEKTSDRLPLALLGGFYSDYLKEWYSVFDDESIQIVFFDDLKKRPGFMLEKIYHWLGLDMKSATPNTFSIENKGFYFKNKSIQQLAIAVNQKFEPFLRQYPFIKKILMRLYRFNVKPNPFVLEEKTKTFLAEFYAPYNKDLQSLLNSKGYSDDIPLWLK